MSSEKAVISRRAVLGKGLALAGSAAAVPLALLSLPAFAFPREKVHYTENGLSPDMVCEKCNSFIPPAVAGGSAECYIVDGVISPKGHCDSWSAKRKKDIDFMK